MMSKNNFQIFGNKNMKKISFFLKIKSGIYKAKKLPRIKHRSEILLKKRIRLHIFNKKIAKYYQNYQPKKIDIKSSLNIKLTYTC